MHRTCLAVAQERVGITDKQTLQMTAALSNPCHGVRVSAETAAFKISLQGLNGLLHVAFITQIYSPYACCGAVIDVLLQSSRRFGG